MHWLRDGPSAATGRINEWAAGHRMPSSSFPGGGNYSTTSTKLPRTMSAIAGRREQQSNPRPHHQPDTSPGPAARGGRRNEVIGARGWQKVNYVKHPVAHPARQDTHAASNHPAGGTKYIDSANVMVCVIQCDACDCQHARV